MSEKMSISPATGMRIAGKKQLSPMQQAELGRTFYTEFKRRTKAGESAPFAGMMAAREQLIARNRIMGGWPRISGV